jgi:hypothetical protein
MFNVHCLLVLIKREEINVLAKKSVNVGESDRSWVRTHDLQFERQATASGLPDGLISNQKSQFG